MRVTGHSLLVTDALFDVPSEVHFKRLDLRQKAEVGVSEVYWNVGKLLVLFCFAHYKISISFLKSVNASRQDGQECCSNEINSLCATDRLLCTTVSAIYLPHLQLFRL
ncbi:hypothetical protein CRM22_011211 [Opisthorchis felineus]|uniref:Uncharacterized protein n=1 Tax=Opisthorchis felineus TaxID=147828 RepID=A0A4S2KBK0_OPIFE|nr:hypothetical protein CRM22_011211 [Opisthorchis felineus]